MLDLAKQVDGTGYRLDIHDRYVPLVRNGSQFGFGQTFGPYRLVVERASLWTVDGVLDKVGKRLALVVRCIVLRQMERHSLALQEDLVDTQPAAYPPQPHDIQQFLSLLGQRAETVNQALLEC